MSGNENGSQPELGRIPGYAVFHAHAAWAFQPGWQLVLRVQNLFDRRYTTAGLGNLNLFPGGQPVLPPAQPQPELFVGPGMGLQSSQTGRSAPMGRGARAQRDGVSL